MLPSDITWAFAAASQLVGAGEATSSGETLVERCKALKTQQIIQHSTLTRLEFVRKDTVIDLSDNVESCNRRSQKVEVDICRVGLQIPTSTRSSISFEVWLPLEWEGERYLATGNGGIDGCA